jgi:hypothetical protein
MLNFRRDRTELLKYNWSEVVIRDKLCHKKIRPS